ncbi:hypothetical protein DPX16_8766 [Anabarilius grahami]|uniref:Uncharacterized protein n=1 Tax=Anabarilius grahami TaxID=495550 RepID=A0A3N0YE13_ANAGA|nr:hypothetical protein DPX16_8766 [Anabarilius grahami]
MPTFAFALVRALRQTSSRQSKRRYVTKLRTHRKTHNCLGCHLGQGLGSYRQLADLCIEGAYSSRKGGAHKQPSETYGLMDLADTRTQPSQYAESRRCFMAMHMSGYTTKAIRLNVFRLPVEVVESGQAQNTPHLQLYFTYFVFWEIGQQIRLQSDK